MFVSHKKPKYKQYFSIDESVGLHKNYSFRLAIFLPVVISIFFIIIFSIQLAIEGQFRLSITQPEVNAFIRYFSFPISILSLSVVFGVMVARFHSSKQKAKSNKITERNNSVNYFYKTHEEFEKFCAKLVSSREYSLKSIRADTLYSVFFSSSSPTAPSLMVSDSFNRAVNSFYSVYVNNLIEYLDSDDFNAAQQRTSRGIGLRYDFSDGLHTKLKMLGLKIEWIGCLNDLSKVENELLKFYDSIYELFAFPGLENRSDSVEMLNKVHLKWMTFLNTHPKFIEFKALQTPQS